jgi:hypothetical protein
MGDGSRGQVCRRDEAEWDAEIEADFQRAVAATKIAGCKKRGRRLVGAPLAFLTDVCRLTAGRAPLLAALLIYRRTCVCRSRTVTLPGEDLSEVGMGREAKRRALARLADAGLIRIERALPGHAATVTLLWNPG